MSHFTTCYLLYYCCIYVITHLTHFGICLSHLAICLSDLSSFQLSHPACHLSHPYDHQSHLLYLLSQFTHFAICLSHQTICLTHFAIFLVISPCLTNLIIHFTHLAMCLSPCHMFHPFHCVSHLYLFHPSCLVSHSSCHFSVVSSLLSVMPRVSPILLPVLPMLHFILVILLSVSPILSLALPPFSTRGVYSFLVLPSDSPILPLSQLSHHLPTCHLSQLSMCPNCLTVLPFESSLHFCLFVVYLNHLSCPSFLLTHPHCYKSQPSHQLSVQQSHHLMFCLTNPVCLNHLTNCLGFCLFHFLTSFVTQVPTRPPVTTTLSYFSSQILGHNHSHAFSILSITHSSHQVLCFLSIQSATQPSCHMLDIHLALSSITY